MNNTESISEEITLTCVSYDFPLGVDGFQYSDLYSPAKLEALTQAFLETVTEAEPDLHEKYVPYLKTGGEGLSELQQSELLLKMAPHLSRFLARLFGIEEERDRLLQEAASQAVIFEFKRDFVERRVLKKCKPGDKVQYSWERLQASFQVLKDAVLPGVASSDEEWLLAKLVCNLMKLEKELELFLDPKKIPLPETTSHALDDLKNRLFHPISSITTAGTGLIPAQELGLIVGAISVGSPEQEARELVRQLLGILEKYVFLLPRFEPERVGKWVSFRHPHPVDYEALVELDRCRPDFPVFFQGPAGRLRLRDGFQLTDQRYTPREVLNEVHYCIYCHEREKDSCSKGLREKDGRFRRNPLGISLAGCPLGEKISEMQLLKKEGDSLGALALVMIDNPMCPGTGHRICNDCMKSCIFQKQDPVNIPQAETGVLTDVLDLPYGFEIYSLLTRWNPLNLKRPSALPYHGKKILIVGMGPAGYTLAQYLLNEGFGVVGVDGLKIEPLPGDLVGDATLAPRPIRDVSELMNRLDQRVLAGFGGVSEYGITVRWDKNFLGLIHLALRRRSHFRVYGGVRFGGTLTIEDAWSLGFDHIAIATGAGKPTIVGMKNNLIRGIRQASDFLMALQLTGAFKSTSMANLQVQLPALVIGGGLTAIDTATELAAYYPLQVEKTLHRFEVLSGALGEERVWQLYDEEEKALLRIFLEHGRAVRSERENAAQARRKADLVGLVRQWGGVTIVYRKSLKDSPAYRLNHEEVVQCLEEGIYFVECLNPVEAIPDCHGAAAAVRFEQMRQEQDGSWRTTGEQVTLPGRTVSVAAGTSPNTIYEREFPGTFQLDSRNEYFLSHKLAEGEDEKIRLVPAGKGERAFFTSYEKDGRYITYYGDNHPVYAGNVVKAMASAKEGYPQIVGLFSREIAGLSPADRPAREKAFQRLVSHLDGALLPRVVRLNRLTPNIIEVIVHAPCAASHFQPGQFYRLQNYEVLSAEIEGSRLTMEGLALTGAWVDREKGLLSMIVLEMGGSSRLCSTLQPGEPLVVMGPTGTPTEIPRGETVLLAGGGLGNAVLFSIGKALRANRNQVLYFAGYKKGEDLYKQDEVEESCDQLIWSTDSGAEILPRRSQDRHFRGNIIQSMKAYAEGQLGPSLVDFQKIDRVIAIGSDRMMAAVKEARRPGGVLGPYIKPDHVAIGSINSPMQCMMKEVCAQCLQKRIDPVSGKELQPVFSCFNQDQMLDQVDFQNLNERLRANAVLEKLSNLWLDYLVENQPLPKA